MRLADFIETAHQEILGKWETFAAVRLPSSAETEEGALQEHVRQILRAIAIDLRRPQRLEIQYSKSHGLAQVVRNAPQTAAEKYGTMRAQGGLSVTQLLSEYRALRACVLRLWAEVTGALTSNLIADDMMRFNEAVDQAMAESVELFSQQLIHERLAREAIERELKLNRGRLEYASRLSNVGFWYCDLPFDILEWDEQVKEHFFIEPAATVTIDDFYDRIHEEDRETTRLAIAASIESGEAYDIVYRTTHPITGEVKWIRALGGTDYADDGRPIHFDGITVDVTAQKLEDKRVSDSEARHRRVFANMKEAFTLFDQDFKIIEVNAAACELVGMTRAELIGESHWVRFPGTYDSELGRMYRQVLADGQSKLLEHCYIFEDVREVWFEVRAFTVEPGIAVFFRDVTERREMIDALKEADKRKDEFLAMLVHELRNPLAPITTAGEILDRIATPGSAISKPVAVIRRQAKHMTRLIDDLLDVARVTQGRIHLQKATVDVASVIAQSYETCEPQLQAKQQRLTVSVEKSAPLFVEGDAARLVQCVGNILTNAIKYTGQYGVITVSVYGEDDLVIIKISDTGSGIAAPLLPRIFDLFVQSQRTLDRSQGGLGIGLAIVKRVVEMHGGRVLAFSDGEGRGSTFELRLPRIAARDQKRADAASIILPPRRIMVVDDNADAAESLVVLLEMKGHTLISVHSANDALMTLESFKPEIMVIDIGLPEIDGYKLVQMLDKSSAHKNVRKIALTGYGQTEDKQRALAVGFDAHLVKPVDIDTLERTIANLS